MQVCGGKQDIKNVCVREREMERENEREREREIERGLISVDVARELLKT